MARIRSVKPELRTSELVASWPMGLRYFWVLLWGYCDDYGRARDNARLIVADAFPLDDDIDASQIRAWMDILAEAGVIKRYDVDDEKYFHITNWSDMQKVSHPSRTVNPAPPWPESDSGATPDTLRSDSGAAPFEGEEGTGSRDREGGGIPTPFCPKHPKGTNDPCRPCGDARKTFELIKRPSLRSVPTPPKMSDRSGFCSEPGHEYYPLAPKCDKCVALAAERSAA